MINIKRALISVYDKRGLPKLLDLLQQASCEIVSTGGTAKFIEEQGKSCTLVESVTDFPEILDGRVKTLHPKIFAGILSRRSSEDNEVLKKHAIGSFDLIVVNLYPFVEQLDQGKRDSSQMMEFVDIGGVALLRAAAKSYANCVVLSAPEQYEEFIAATQQKQTTIAVEVSRKFAAQALAKTAAYDWVIANYLATDESEVSGFPNSKELLLNKQSDLAYGENPHQKAALYSKGGGMPIEQLGGKPLSYNNIVDLDGCLGTLGDFLADNACVIVKHANPCGIGVSHAGDTAQAYDLALAGDPLSAFGGIVGFSRSVDRAVAEKLVERFYEIVVAPDFATEAVEILAQKKKLRIIKFATDNVENPPNAVLRQTLCGFLLQQPDTAMESVAEAKVVTKRSPSENELVALQVAWKACKWLKSNAIVVASAERTLGMGGGQTSRVDAVTIALQKSGEAAKGAALASDAFFPFRDGLDQAKKAGISAVVQPGGSIRDQEVIDAANEHGMAMLFTGKRHFRH